LVYQYGLPKASRASRIFPEALDFIGAGGGD